MASENAPADVGGNGNHLRDILDDEELLQISENVSNKINKYIDSKFEEYLTSKALYEATRNKSDETIIKLENELLILTAKYDDVNSKSIAAETMSAELKLQLDEMKIAYSKASDALSRQESEIASMKSARDAAIDEKNDLARSLERRDAELERLRGDVDTLTSQLQAAVFAKCSALSNADKIEDLEKSLKCREHQMEEGRKLLNSQIAGLNVEVSSLTTELQSMRMTYTTQVLTLEAQLAGKIQLLNDAQDTIAQLHETNKNLNHKAENLADRLYSQRQNDNKMFENYKKELEAKTKLAEAFQGMLADATAKEKELTEGFSQLQRLLDEATEKCGDLETKNKQMELEHEEIVQKKNEIIASLKSELENANELMKAANASTLDMAIGNLAPSAAAASKLLKSGMSLSQVYSQLVIVMDDLAREKDENHRLNATLSSIVQELEERAPTIQQQQMEYEETLENNRDLTLKLESVDMENHKLRDVTLESSNKLKHYSRENQRLKSEIADLGRQVCYLLKEIEQSRGGSVPNGDQHSSSAASNSTEMSSNRLISKNLVTFSDIQELQSNNQKLLRAVRELTEKQEELERNHDQIESGELQSKLQTMTDRVTELTEAQERQIKMVNGLIHQRDMYKKLYQDCKKNTDTENQGVSMEVTSEPVAPFNVVIEAKLKETEKQLEFIKEEHKTYKEAKQANEQMLIELVDSLRKEVSKLTALNSKSQSTAEYNNERLQILQANIATYKKQISSLESKTKAYSDTISKHETSIQHLTNEILSAQSKLSKAEVTAENLRQECKLLKDAETRYQTEKEMMNREKHGQSILLNNLEIIKLSLERSDTEGRMRLESRLDEATRECSALRRRLQEEQDRFRELATHLERQTDTAKSRMEEEKNAADTLRKELSTLKDDLASLRQHNDELTEKLKEAMNPNKSDVSFEKYKKVKELEKLLADKESSLNLMQDQLKVAKEHIKQYCDISEYAEKELKTLNESFENYKKESNDKMLDFERKKSELVNRCSELEKELNGKYEGHGTLSDLTAELFKTREELELSVKAVEDVKLELELSRNEVTAISKNVQDAEDKYAHEMLLHSSDIQALTNFKEELFKSQQELSTVKSLKDEALASFEYEKKSWYEREKIISSEQENMKSRLSELNEQNTLLLDQVQALSTQLSVAHAPKNSTSLNESDTSVPLDQSFSESEHRSSEQLFQIIRLLRREKDVAFARSDIQEAQNQKSLAELNITKKLLEETKAAFALAREKAESNVITIAKHAEILRQVETLNAITDSNRILREERDNLMNKVSELNESYKELELTVTPLKEKIAELTAKNDGLVNDNIFLKSETEKLRNRVNTLTERVFRTSPEDWKRLQTEREALVKMLSCEKENVGKLKNQLNNLTAEKNKYLEQLNKLSEEHNDLVSMSKKQAEELDTLKQSYSKLCDELNEYKAQLTEQLDENTKIVEELSSKESELNKFLSKEKQIKNIAKKYKTQYEDLLKSVEDDKKKMSEETASSSATAEELEVSEQRATELHNQLGAAQTDLEKARNELEQMRTTFADKDEKGKQVLKQAKTKIVQLTEENNNLSRELVESRNKINTIEQNRDEHDVRLALLKSQYEGRLVRLEKERNEAQAERTREVDALLQKINLLQRQLSNQTSGSKQQPSGTEKTTSDPPTANIKPMAGVVQQSVTPSRRAGEPPLASIRPMAQHGTRTAAVLPTSAAPATPPANSQAAHTTGASSELSGTAPSSSHTTEYMPASSSRPLPHMPRLAPPTQPAAHTPPHAPAAESTQQDNESEARPGSAGGSDSNTQPAAHSQTPQQAVALVLPRVEQPQPAGSAGGSAPEAPAPAPQQAPSSSGAGASSGVSTSEPAPHRGPRPTKRQRPASTRTPQPLAKKTRQGFEIEYQVPTSSRCDQEDEGVIVVDSEEDEDNQCTGTAYQEEVGDSYMEEEDDVEDDEEEEEEEGGDEEAGEGVAEGVAARESADPDDEGSEAVGGEASAGGTEGADATPPPVAGAAPAPQPAEEASQELPAQSSDGEPQSAETRPQMEAIISGTEAGGTLINLGGGGAGAHAVAPSYEDGDDSIVPSTPTLYVPRRGDGFGEAVSSPVAGGSGGGAGRFTFGDAAAASAMDDTHPDLAAQLAPPAPLTPAPSEGVRAEESEVDEGARGTGDDDSLAVSSQGSAPASPATHQVAEEGREAEASASPSMSAARGTPPTRNTYRIHPHYRSPAPIMWHNEGEGGRGMRGTRNMRGRGARRPTRFMRY